MERLQIWVELLTHLSHPLQPHLPYLPGAGGWEGPDQWAAIRSCPPPALPREQSEVGRSPQGVKSLEWLNAASSP